MVDEPLADHAGPDAEGSNGAAESAAVDAVVEDVKFGGDVVAGESGVEVQGVLDGDGRVALGYEEECGRRGWGDMQLIGHIANQGG